MRREKGIGTQEVTVQILGDSFVNGAFFQGRVVVEELYSRYKTGRTKEYKE